MLKSGSGSTITFKNSNDREKTKNKQTHLCYPKIICDQERKSVPLRKINILGLTYLFLPNLYQ